MLIAFLVMVFILGILAALLGLIGGIIAFAFKLVFWLIPAIFVIALIIGLPILIIIGIIKLLL